MDDAGAALTGIAADVSAGQVEVFAQEVDKEDSVLNIYRHSPTVDR
jgi:hypothetical protein